MSGKLTCTVYVSYGFIVAAVGFHVVGFLTNVWFSGASNGQDDEIVKITMGLWEMVTEYGNGTLIERDSLLNLREEHYIMLAEAGANFLLCFVVLFKHIHVCVGVIAFVNMTLLLLSAFYSFVHLEKAKEDLQEIFVEWPELSVSWSFCFVWAGILVNLIATGVFLTALLIKGEMKAAHSSKGLGPSPEIVINHTNEEKVMRITTISNDNYGYNTEHENKYSYHSNTGTSYPGSSHEQVEPVAEKTSIQLESSEQESIGFDAIRFEEEAEVPYYIGKINADDAENLEFGFRDSDLELPKIAEEQTGSQSDDDNIIESSRL